MPEKRGCVRVYTRVHWDRMVFRPGQNLQRWNETAFSPGQASGGRPHKGRKLTGQRILRLSYR